MCKNIAILIFFMREDCSQQVCPILASTATLELIQVLDLFEYPDYSSGGKRTEWVSHKWISRLEAGLSHGICYFSKFFAFS